MLTLTQYGTGRPVHIDARMIGAITQLDADAEHGLGERTRIDALPRERDDVYGACWLVLESASVVKRMYSKAK